MDINQTLLTTIYLDHTRELLAFKWELTIGFYQIRKGCFSLQECGHKQLLGKREGWLSTLRKKKEIFHLLCVDTQSYKHITGGRRGISAVCHMQSWNEPVHTWAVGWAQCTRKAVKLPLLISFILSFLLFFWFCFFFVRSQLSFTSFFGVSEP